MNYKEDGGPAFPMPENWRLDTGMTLRKYAAIKLRVPDSGTDWLDDMIRESQRDEFAAKAMQALFDSDAGHSRAEIIMIAGEAYAMADAMLEARKSK